MADEVQREDQELPARGWVDDVYNGMDDSYTDRLLARIRGSEGAESDEKPAAPAEDKAGPPE